MAIIWNGAAKLDQKWKVEGMSLSFKGFKSLNVKLIEK
jgi:hypothetical protein